MVDKQIKRCIERQKEIETIINRDKNQLQQRYIMMLAQLGVRHIGY